MEDEIVLSVCCAVYNHEPYLPKALDSILMQECSFNFEVIIAEDCSSDNSRAILYEYQARYPGRFNVLYRKANYGVKRNFDDLYMHARGKYIVVLEMDDYWMDSKKLQKQIEFLETHSDAIAVAHNCVVVNENDIPNGELYPECHNAIYTLKEFRKGLLPGQTTTLMHRNIYKDKLTDMSLIENGIGAGDRRKIFTLMQCGNIYCIQEVMSAYRHVTKGGTSFSATLKTSTVKEIEYYKQFADYCKQINANKEYEASAEYMVFINLLSALKKREVTLLSVIKRFSSLRHKYLIVRYLIER